jgi:outer membrane assembly lipoprotein YfiO
MLRKLFRYTWILAALAALAFSVGCRKKAYENPIAKDTQQPDKVMFDKAMDNVEHGRYERARLMLQTLMNTYDTSEYLAKAKLLYADSWFREGGTHGLAQAEAEYKDFILFYPAAPTTNAAPYWCSSLTASSRRKWRKCCATFRKCLPTVSSKWAISIARRAVSRPSISSL